MSIRLLICFASLLLLSVSTVAREKATIKIRTEAIEKGGDAIYSMTDSIDLPDTIEFKFSDYDQRLLEYQEGLGAFSSKMTIIDMFSITPDELAELNKIADVKMAVDNSLKLDTIAVFPNPSDGIFTIDFTLNDNKPTRVIIYSSSGKLLLNDTVKAINGTYKRSIDIRDQDDGYYFLQIAQGEKSWCGKIIKSQ